MINGMRYLGIDYGMRRIGLATADGDTRIAVPQSALKCKNDAQAIDEITSVVKKEEIEKIIIGLPLGLDGRKSEMSAQAISFGEKLRAASGLPVEFENEMLTSRMAHDAGMRGSNIDASSAAIILQSYLDKKR